MTKTALISGGARGIGRCLVRRFCELGYRVYVLDNNEVELEHAVNVHLRQYSERDQLASGLCDLRNTSQIQKQVVAAAEFLNGQIDVVINNGGIAQPYWKDEKTMADKDTLEQWKAYVNLFKMILPVAHTAQLY